MSTSKLTEHCNQPIKNTVTATQPQLLTPVSQTSLVLIPSPKENDTSAIYGKPGSKQSYTLHPTSSTPHTDHLTNIILFSTLLQKTTMTTSQAIIYTFAWSTCLLHHHAASATEVLSKTPLYNYGSAQPGQPLIQQYSLNTPDHYSNLLTPPWPYNLLIHTPKWIQITLLCIFIFIIFARPAYSLLLYIQWCVHVVTLRAPLAGRHDAAPGVGLPRGIPRLAMAPVIRELLARQQAQVSTLQLKVERLETTIKDIKNLQYIHTRAMFRTEQESNARFQALEQILEFFETTLRQKLDQPYRSQPVVAPGVRADS